MREQWIGAEQNLLRLKMLKNGRKQFESCAECPIVEYTWHPEDILDGYEDEIIERMLLHEDITREQIEKE